MLESGVGREDIAHMLRDIDPHMLETQNAGLVQNWISFAQGERDDRVDIDEAIKNPDLASTLALNDLTAALARVKEMKGAERKEPALAGRSPEPDLYAMQ